MRAAGGPFSPPASQCLGGNIAWLEGQKLLCFTGIYIYKRVSKCKYLKVYTSGVLNYIGEKPTVILFCTLVHINRHAETPKQRQKQTMDFDRYVQLSYN